MAFTVNIKVEGADDIIKKLNKIKAESQNVLPKVTEGMAKSTQQTAKNEINPHWNHGDLEKSINFVTGSNGRMSVSSVFTSISYAKYVHDGTSGTWFVHESDPRLDVSKLAKYEGHIPYKNGFYMFHGQSPKPFMTDAFQKTLNSNFSFAKSKYVEAILRGIN